MSRLTTLNIDTVRGINRVALHVTRYACQINSRVILRSRDHECRDSLMQWSPTRCPWASRRSPIHPRVPSSFGRYGTNLNQSSLYKLIVLRVTRDWLANAWIEIYSRKPLAADAEEKASDRTEETRKMLHARNSVRVYDGRRRTEEGGTREEGADVAHATRTSYASYYTYIVRLSYIRLSFSCLFHFENTNTKNSLRVFSSNAQSNK